MCERHTHRNDINRDDPWWYALAGYSIAGLSAGLAMGVIDLICRLF